MSLSSFRDLYVEVGVELAAGADPAGVSLGEINRAFKRTAKRYHPDKNPLGRTRFESASNAVEVLRNADQRAKYDGEYRAHQREQDRMAKEDANTKRMRQDLYQRENNTSSSSQDAMMMDRLQRETLHFTQSTRTVLPQLVKRFSIEEHLARERVILKAALAE